MVGERLKRGLTVSEWEKQPADTQESRQAQETTRCKLARKGRFDQTSTIITANTRNGSNRVFYSTPCITQAGAAECTLQTGQVQTSPSVQYSVPPYQ